LRELLETTRLVLRRYRPSDAEAVHRLIDDWEVVRWLAQVPYPYSLADARGWIDRTVRDWNSGIDHQFAILKKTAGGTDLVGAVGLRADPARSLRVRELGYWFTPNVWGHGLGTEAALAMLDFGFGDIGMEMVWATALPDNSRSQRVLMKAGLVADGVQTGHFVPIGKTVECPRFVLSRERYALWVSTDSAGVCPT
ncbi:MAG: GNAT family N-acetyltransferase, partial [Sphingomonadales bacterium]